MKLQYYLVGILLASSFMVGTGLFLADLKVHTGLSVNNSFTTTYDKSVDILQAMNKTNEKLKGTTVQSTTLQPLQLASYPIMQITYDNFSLIYDMITNAITALGIAPWVATTILTLIAIGLTFALLSAIFFGRQV